MDIKERIKAIASHYQLSINNFERRAGLSNGYVNNIRNSISDHKLEQISNSFPEINPVWLKMEIGDMLKSEDLKAKVNTLVVGEIQNPESESSFIDIGNGQYIMVVPIVPIKAQAGYIEHYNDERFIEENFTQKHSFAVSRVYRGKYMAFIIDGDSMDNGTSESIIEGSTVTGREIQKTHWRNKFHINRYKDYVIVHHDGIFTKRIIEHDTENGIITCHSLNPNKDLYSDFELNLDECLQIFNIVNVTQPR